MLRRNRERSTNQVPAAAAAKAGGKGRPTPKRSEAVRGRRRVAAPANRKEAYRRMREEQRAQRAKTVDALRGGDERHLPATHRGPVRRYARDFVDARRSVAELWIPVAFVIILLSLTPSTTLQYAGTLLSLMILVLFVVDSTVLIVGLKRGLRRTYPEENTKGVTPYALIRSMQIRRFRTPPPRVRAGRRRR